MRLQLQLQLRYCSWPQLPQVHCPLSRVSLASRVGSAPRGAPRISWSGGVWRWQRWYAACIARFGAAVGGQAACGRSTVRQTVPGNGLTAVLF